MVFLTWENVRKNKISALWDLFLFLASHLVLGSAFVVSAALIPAIMGTLSLSVLPSFMASFLILLPSLVCLALSIRFLWLHYWLITGLGSEFGLNIHVRREHTSSLLRYYTLNLLLEYISILKNSFLMGIRSHFQWHDQNQQEKRDFFDNLLDKYLFGAALTSLVMGIYLSVVILPTLIPIVALATGLPYTIVLLFAMLAATVLIMLTYDLLVLPLRCVDMALRFKFWKEADEYNGLFLHLITGLVVLPGVGLTAYAAYFLFPLMMHALLPLLPTATAGFTAVLVCVGLVVLAITTLPQVVQFLGELLRTLADGREQKNSSKFTTAFKDFERNCRTKLLGKELTIKQEFQAGQCLVEFVNEDKKWARGMMNDGTVFYQKRNPQQITKEYDDCLFRLPPPCS